MQILNFLSPYRKTHSKTTLACTVQNMQEQKYSKYLILSTLQQPAFMGKHTFLLYTGRMQYLHSYLNKARLSQNNISLSRIEHIGTDQSKYLVDFQQPTLMGKHVFYYIQECSTTFILASIRANSVKSTLDYIVYNMYEQTEAYIWTF